MNYKILRKYHLEGQNTLKKIDCDFDFENHFSDGSEKQFEKIKIEFEDNSSSLTDLPIGATTVFIVSEKMKEIIESIEDEKNIQWIPVEIKNQEFKDNKYWVLNILEYVEGMDRNKSEYTEFPPFLVAQLPHLKNKPEKISKLKLNMDAIKERHIFRLNELPTAVFCSDKLSEAFVQEKVSGIRFVDIKDYSKEFFM